jgi:glycosyltransferase domain-containing protein
MHDLTLVILTHNRAQCLAALLSYLETEEADCHILVLDSSRPDVLRANRAWVERSRLDVEFAAFPDLESDEKRRRGIHKVTTPFCTVCADSDLVILDGVWQCVDILRHKPAASVAQGRSFWFKARSDDEMEVKLIAHSRVAIEDISPLSRLRNLLQQYQTLKSGVFRTAALLRILDSLQPITKALARDLLWSALTVIEGQLVRISKLSYGRGMDSSHSHDHSCLLKWLCKEPNGVFAEYLRYREVLARAVMQRSDNELEPDEVRDVLDLMHLRYFLQRVPDSMLQFVAERQIADDTFEHYWPHWELNSAAQADIAARTSPRAVRSPLHIQGRQRSYLLSSDFWAPPEEDSPSLDSVVRLLAVLDNYRPCFEMEPNANPTS